MTYRVQDRPHANTNVAVSRDTVKGSHAGACQTMDL